MRGSYHEGWNQPESALTPATVGRLAVRWSTSLAGSGWAPATGSPVVVGAAVFVGGRTVTRHYADTGALEWSTPVAAPRATSSGVPTTPAFAHGIVVAATADSRSTVAAMNADTGRVLWRRVLSGRVESSPTIWGETVFVGRGGDSVLALSLRSGAVKWTWTSSDSTEMLSSPTTDGSMVYVSALAGTRVVALDAATGAVRWMRSLDSGNGWTMDGFTMSLLGGRLYLGNIAGAVYALTAATGATACRVDTGGAVWRAVAATPGAILVETGDTIDTLLALSPADGHRLWSYSPTGQCCLSTATAVAGGVAYVGFAEADVGMLDALDVATGRLLRRVVLSDTYEPMGPAVSAGRVYVADWEHLLALQVTAPTPGAPRHTAPPIAGGGRAVREAQPSRFAAMAEPGRSRSTGRYANVRQRIPGEKLGCPAYQRRMPVTTTSGHSPAMRPGISSGG